MGSLKSLLPLSHVPGREITSDTLLLSELASEVQCDICFDLGTGTGEVLRNTFLENAFKVGIDKSEEALRFFDNSSGQAILCSVEAVSSLFRENCADLVLANPPYNTEGSSRISPDHFRREARAGKNLLLHRFIFAAAYLLKPGGSLILTGREERREEMELGLRAAGFSSIERICRRGVMALKALKNS